MAHVGDLKEAEERLGIRENKSTTCAGEGA